MKNFSFKIRIAVQRKKLNALRIELGNLRQRTNDADPRVRVLQTKIGEVEMILDKCERLVKQ